MRTSKLADLLFRVSGFGATFTLAMCGIGSSHPIPDLAPPPIRYSVNIQKDLSTLSCTAVGCHSSNATNKLKIDTTPGQEMVNYESLFTNRLVVPGNAVQSPLIIVPKTGYTLSDPPVPHVTTLTGTRLSQWQDWVNNMAPF